MDSQNKIHLFISQIELCHEKMYLSACADNKTPGQPVYARSLDFAARQYIFITKTRLFKYIENFITKNRKFSYKFFYNILISAQ